jgi:hypothetical protein
MRRPLVLVIAVVCVPAILGGALLVFRGGEGKPELTAGPIYWGFPNGTSGWSYPGKPFYYGLAEAVNVDPQGRPAVFEGVSLVNPSPGLRITKLYTIHLNDEPRISATSPVIPPATGERLYPFYGTTLAATRRTIKHKLTYGIGVVMQGPANRQEYNFDGLVLRYRIGETQYEVTMWDRARFCVAPDPFHPPFHCEVPPSGDNVPQNPAGMGP